MKGTPGTLRLIKIGKAPRIKERKRESAPSVPPRVTPAQALRALKAYPGGPRVIDKLQSEGFVPLLTEFAYFSPRTKTGRARWIDFWNADLFDSVSHLNALHTLDRIQFRTDPKTYLGGLNLGNPNGFVQASFEMPAQKPFVAVVVLSGGPAMVRVRLDNAQMPYFWVDADHHIFLITAQELAAGPHWITLIQRKVPSSWGYKNIWFHSITCYRIDE